MVYKSRSEDAGDGRVGQEKDLAGEKPKLHVTAVQKAPLSITVADELADMGNHERLRAIGIEASHETIGCR
jgi:hypothetical protein